MDIEASTSIVQMKEFSNAKFELSNEEEIEGKNKLISNGLSMNLIDRKNLEFDQFEEAISITKSQINTILQFNHKNEFSSLQFLNNQIIKMESLLKEMQEYKTSILQEKNSAIKNLEKFVEYEIKYSNKNVTIEEEIKYLSRSEKELEETQNKLLEIIKNKKNGLEALLNMFDQDLFNQVKTLLSQRLPIIWQVQEILIGILLHKEKATTQEIQDAYSNFEVFLKLIKGKYYESFSPISAWNTHKNIEAMHLEISKVEKPENEELNKFLEKFISIIKLLCELSIHYHDLKKNEANLLEMKSCSNDGAKKSKGIFNTEIKLIINQIKGFDGIQNTLDSNIHRKQQEIEQINELIRSLPDLCQKGLQKDVPESFKQEVYRKQNLNTNFGVLDN